MDSVNAILDTFPDGVVIYDLEGNVQYVNPAFTKRFGYQTDKLLGHSIPFVPDSEQKVTQQALEQIIAGNPVSNWDTKRLKSNGDRVDVTLSGSLYYDKSGQPAGILVVFRDMGIHQERKDKPTVHAEELEKRVAERTHEIEKERQKLQSLVDEAPLGISIVHHDGRVEYVNRRFSEVFGEHLSEISDYRKWLDDRLCDTPDGRRAKKMGNLILNGAYAERTLNLVNKNGQKKIIALKCIPLPNNRHFITYQDITDRENVERELRIKTHYLEKLAAMDSLTSLYNKRTFMEILEKEVLRAQRYHETLSLLMVDLDCFKEVNDTHGHLFGDHVLKEVALTMKSAIRTSDVLARYGGEEFIGLLVNTGLQDAEIMGERLRQSVANQLLEEHRKAARITISVGVSSMQIGSKDTPKQLIARADEALYRAKAKGRNRVCLSLSNKEDQHDGQWLTNRGPSSDVIKNSLTPLMDIFKKDSMEVIFRLTELFRGDAVHFKEFKEHAIKMGALFDQLQRFFPLPENVLNGLKCAAHLHELSRYLADREILLKNTPRSDYDKEFQSLHINLLDEVVDNFQIFSAEKSILRYHHENYDGKGYPLGLAEDEIPIVAKIYHIIDAIASMQSDRPYRPPYTNSEIINELDKGAGTQFDPSVVRIIKQILEAESDCKP